MTYQGIFLASDAGECIMYKLVNLKFEALPVILSLCPVILLLS